VGPKIESCKYGRIKHDEQTVERTDGSAVDGFWQRPAVTGDFRKTVGVFAPVQELDVTGPVQLEGETHPGHLLCRYGSLPASGSGY